MDRELWERYEEVQAQYAKHNIVENIKTAVVLYADSIPVGSGCFKRFDDQSIEIKRMFVTEQSRGKGFSKRILEELENWGAELGYKRAVLETGLKQPEAIALYQGFGYSRIPNYQPYVGLPQSVCFKKELTA